MSRRALIFGISGQDGAYLTELLLRKGYMVSGTSRDAELSSFQNLHTLGIRDKVSLSSASPSDFRSVMQAIKLAEPDEIYNLSGQSSVGLSFGQPMETMESIVTATLNILEAIRFLIPAYASITLAQASVTAIQACSLPTRKPLSGRVAPTRPPRQRRIGRWPTIVTLTVYMPALASCSITSRRCGRHAL
jgi:GDP-D-mannose dehydratase